MGPAALVRLPVQLPVRPLAAALVVSFLLPASSEATVRYIAYGDSITRGSSCDMPGDPVPPDDVFDGDGPGCKPNVKCSEQTQADADGCGYAWRLEASLGAAGIDAEVVNAGEAGERTPEGLTRIDSWLGPNEHVLLLMEGTNDVSRILRDHPQAIFPEAIRDNLRMMIDKATEQGMDAALATVIKRVCPGGFPDNCVGPTPQANPNESWTNDLNSKIRTLADSETRGKVDVAARLCNSQTCVDNNYFQNDIKIGHLDEDGYDILAPLFDDVVVADPILGAPTPVSPSDETGPLPTFVWNELGGATLYRLEIEDDLGAVVVDDWFDGAEVCGGGSCSAVIDTPLTSGDHSWRVRARNLRGDGPWSAWTSFRAYGAAPGQVTLVSPPPDLYDDQPPFDVTYSWEPEPESTAYQLIVENSSGVRLIDQSFDHAAVCTGSLCAATPAALPAAGSYEWRARATNPAGSGAYSPRTAFAVVDSAPGESMQLSPLIDTFKTDPLFKWSAVFGAADYKLEVDGPPRFVFDASVCSGDICSARAGLDLAVGNHTWRLKGRNPLGDAPWAPNVTFEVLACSPLVLMLDADDTGTSDHFDACDTLTAGSGFEIRQGESVTLHTGSVVSLEDGFSVSGSLTIRVDE